MTAALAPLRLAMARASTFAIALTLTLGFKGQTEAFKAFKPL